IEKDIGLGGAEKAAEAMGIPSWQEFRQVGPSLAGDEISYEKLQEMMMTEGDKMLEASKGMLTASEGMTDAMKLAEDNAKLNQQWYSDFAAFWTNALGLVVKALGGGKDIFETIQEGALGVLTAGEGEEIRQTDRWQDIAAQLMERGKYAPEVQESRRKFAESGGGVTYEMLGEYTKPGGRMEQGLSMLIPPAVELEIAQGKYVNITFTVTDGVAGEEVGGTLGK
ncbi:hypothetical protein LCGC14_2599810, partial [marine sediment metagenome]